MFIVCSTEQRVLSTLSTCTPWAYIASGPHITSLYRCQYVLQPSMQAVCHFLYPTKVHTAHIYKQIALLQGFSGCCLDNTTTAKDFCGTEAKSSLKHSTITQERQNTLCRTCARTPTNNDLISFAYQSVQFTHEGILPIFRTHLSSTIIFTAFVLILKYVGKV